MYVTRFAPALLSLSILSACTVTENKDTGATDTAEDTSGDTGTVDTSDGVYEAGAVGWDTTMSYFGVSEQIGLQVTFTCPAGTADDFYSIWGTGIYTDDSSICTAAVHDGRITLDGGSATAEIREGLASYEPSTANGVTSDAWDAWGSSFVFLPE